MTDILLKLFVKDYKDTQNPSTRSGYGLLSGIVGIILNIILFGIKLTAGLISGSASIFADAFNNLSDAGSSVVTLVGFKIANKPVDKDHPFGHGRMEYLAGFIVAMLIILVGVELLQSSLTKLIKRDFGAEFSTITLVILGVSILIKVWMAIFNSRLAKKINSEAIHATSIDSRSDAIQTTVVLVSAIIMKFTNLNFLDTLLGSIVGVIIIISGIKSAKDMVDVLLGKAPEKEFSEGIVKYLMDKQGVIGVHDLIVHNYGPGRMMISVHAEVPAEMNFLDAHELIDSIENEMSQKYNCGVVIHMDPVVTGDENLKKLKLQVREIVKSIDQSFDIHDFRMTVGKQKSNLIFDIVRTGGVKMSDEEILSFVRTEVKKINPDYQIIAHVEMAYV